MGKFKGGRLPSGDWTDDLAAYTAAWDELRKPLEARGFQVLGFEPGLMLCDAETGQGVVSLPVWAAIRLLKAA